MVFFRVFLNQGVIITPPVNKKPEFDLPFPPISIPKPGTPRNTTIIIPPVADYIPLIKKRVPTYSEIAPIMDIIKEMPLHIPILDEPDMDTGSLITEDTSNFFSEELMAEEDHREMYRKAALICDWLHYLISTALFIYDREVFGANTTLECGVGGGQLAVIRSKCDQLRLQRLYVNRRPPYEMLRRVYNRNAKEIPFRSEGALAMRPFLNQYYDNRRVAMGPNLPDFTFFITAEALGISLLELSNVEDEFRRAISMRQGYFVSKSGLPRKPNELNSVDNLIYRDLIGLLKWNEHNGLSFLHLVRQARDMLDVVRFYLVRFHELAELPLPNFSDPSAYKGSVTSTFNQIYLDFGLALKHDLKFFSQFKYSTQFTYPRYDKKLALYPSPFPFGHPVWEDFKRYQLLPKDSDLRFQYVKADDLRYEVHLRSGSSRYLDTKVNRYLLPERKGTPHACISQPLKNDDFSCERVYRDYEDAVANDQGELYYDVPDHHPGFGATANSADYDSIRYGERMSLVEWNYFFASRLFDTRHITPILYKLTEQLKVLDKAADKTIIPVRMYRALFAKDLRDFVALGRFGPPLLLESVGRQQLTKTNLALMDTQISARKKKTAFAKADEKSAVIDALNAEDPELFKEAKFRFNNTKKKELHRAFKALKEAAKDPNTKPEFETSVQTNPYWRDAELMALYSELTDQALLVSTALDELDVCREAGEKVRIATGKYPQEFLDAEKKVVAEAEKFENCKLAIKEHKRLRSGDEARERKAMLKAGLIQKKKKLPIILLLYLLLFSY